MTGDPQPVMDLSTYLEGRAGRADVAEPLKVADPVKHLEIALPEEVCAATVGLLMLERAAAQGGTRIPARAIRALRQRLTALLSSREVMTLEVEAYDTLCWLIGLRDPEEVDEPKAPPPGDLIDYDPEMPVLDLLRRAIVEEFDVEVQYYTQSRGELTRRRISPHHVQAETYLHAYCHTRLAERVFRISRIAEIRPVDGRPVHQSAEKPRGSQGTLDF